jgi:CBS-domain-containing membrane protein
MNAFDRVICVTTKTKIGEAFVTLLQNNISAVACIDSNKKLQGEITANHLRVRVF